MLRSCKILNLPHNMCYTLPVHPSWHRTHALTTNGQHPLNQTILPYVTSLSPPRTSYHEGNAQSKKSTSHIRYVY